jgi:hypothetical protein
MIHEYHCIVLKYILTFETEFSNITLSRAMRIYHPTDTYSRSTEVTARHSTEALGDRQQFVAFIGIIFLEIGNGCRKCKCT